MRSSSSSSSSFFLSSFDQWTESLTIGETRSAMFVLINVLVRGTSRMTSILSNVCSFPLRVRPPR